MSHPARGERAQLRLLRSSATPEKPPPPPALDDSELLAELRRGGADAATSLYRRARPAVVRTVGRLLGHGDRDAEDLAQQAMIAVVYSIERFRGDCALDSWISSVTANVVYKHIRRRKTERRIFSTDQPESPPGRREDGPPSGHDPGVEAVAKQLLRRVRHHLDGIDEAKTWTYLLHDVCGYDLRDVAAITEVSVAAAQTHLVRGRRELHERLATDPELANALVSLGDQR